MDGAGHPPGGDGFVGHRRFPERLEDAAVAVPDFGVGAHPGHRSRVVERQAIELASLILQSRKGSRAETNASGEIALTRTP